MCDQTYLECLKNILEVDLKLLCPWKEGSDNLKLSRLFLAISISPLVLMLIMTSLIYYEWKTLPFLTVAENVALAITMARSVGYSILVKVFYCEYKKQIGQLLDDRRTLPLEPKEQSMTESYCKTEYRLTLAHHLNSLFILVALHLLVYFSPNAYQLPFNCYITFLPPDGFLFAWEINFLVLTVTMSLTTIPTGSYVPLPFILMNQSCWLIDMALMTAERINEDLQLDEDINNRERVEKTNENLKKFVERCEKFVEWQSEAQDLLSWYFDLEFQVQALILCLCIYVLSFTFSGGVMSLLFIFCAVQTFILCWMGTRVRTRIDQLSFEISKNWYLMPPPQRKTLQMILHWTQNMKEFSGLFKNVSLETCKEIFEASYSFYAFLRSTNTE